MAERGRPSKLEPKVLEKFLEAIGTGAGRVSSARYAGIDPTTFQRWMNHGKLPGKRYEEYRFFRREVLLAESKVEIRDAALLATFAKTEWKAAAWRLEHLFPKRWGPRIRITVEEELNAFLDKLQSRLSPEEYERILSIAIGDGEAGETTVDGDSEPTNQPH